MAWLPDKRLQEIADGHPPANWVEDVSMAKEVIALRKIADAVVTDLSNGHTLPAAEVAVMVYDKEGVS